MLFSSSIFLFSFLPIAIIVYYLLKKNLRIYFLFLASLFFYAWAGPKYVLVILASITLNYVLGLLIEFSRHKYLLYICVLCNLGILFYFKYLNFTVASINRFFHTDLVYNYIIMPIGISFFTFQGMSYVLDIYNKKIKAQKNPIIVAFYISFFPQLVAGPIIRYADIKSQIYERVHSFEKFSAGVRRFIIGLSKKVLIANTVGYTADQIFANPAVENTAATAWVGIICYTFQIFFDFSGYSDMAIGLAKMFGFDFLENFNYPYISKSVTEFWRRWHISLSSWFRDYLYIPLGGNRRGNVYVNLALVFIATGIWHGANFTFLVWGLWHGLFLIIERLLRKIKFKKTLIIPLRHAVTMLIVMVGWVFFRADGLGKAFSYLGIMFGFISPKNVGFTVWYYLDAKLAIVLLIALAVSMPIYKLKLFDKLRHFKGFKYVAAVLSLALFLVSAAFVMASSYNPFIYFQF